MSEMESCQNCGDQDPHCSPEQQKEWCVRKKLEESQLRAIRFEIVVAIVNEDELLKKQLEVYLK
jgi:hypothetical protein